MIFIKPGLINLTLIILNLKLAYLSYGKGFWFRLSHYNNKLIIGSYFPYLLKLHNENSDNPKFLSL